MMRDTIRVTSHVGRDVLQSAGLFKHAEQVVWEYVVNGLQYVDPGVAPYVRIEIQSTPKRIRVTDNGRGMDHEGLRRFFTMHAENQDRQTGRPGRGFFGTGKSAAFAIANTLRISTVRNGARSVVELHRADLDAASTGDPVPVRLLEMETPTGDANGTIVDITDFNIKRIDRNQIEAHIEQQIRRQGRGARIEVNGRPIEPNIPPIASTVRHVVTSEESHLLAGHEIVLHTAKAPLEEADRGIAILASDTLQETTLGTVANKPMANYIFGEIDVPALNEPHNGVAAFDMSRSGKLNAENELVAETLAVVSRHVEALRLALVEQETLRKNAADAAKLERQADEIARLINEDYAEFSKRFNPVRTDQSGASDLARSKKQIEGGEQVLIKGGEVPAVNEGEVFIGGGGNGPGPGPDPTEQIVKEAESEEATTTGRSSEVEPSRRRRSGGFNVQFRENGPENRRAFYNKETRTILVNLDHPQIVAARGSADVTDTNFRRISFEVAFTEYAIGVAQESALGNYYTDFDQPLFDIRDRIDTLARKAAHFFRIDS